MNDSDVMALIKSRTERHYVYVLRGTNGPFYVGVGTGRRILDHAIVARRGSLDSHKLRVIRKIWREGGDIDYSIHAWFSEREEAEKAEAELITSLGRRDLRTGNLTNITSGGEGAPNPSDEVIAQRSVALRSAWAKRDKIKAMAHLRDPAVRKKIVEARTGKKRGAYEWVNKPGPKESGRKRLSEILVADPVSRRPGVAAKISATLMGRTVPNHHMKSPEMRARYSGKNNPIAVPLMIAGQLYETRKHAAQSIGVCRATIDYWIKHGHHGATRLPK